MKTATDTRDRRAIASVACPRCHAPAGTACRFMAGIPDSVRQGRPYCHNERRALWRETKPRVQPEADAVGVALTPKGRAAAAALDHAVELAKRLLDSRYRQTIEILVTKGAPRNVAADAAFMALCELRAALRADLTKGKTE